MSTLVAERSQRTIALADGRTVQARRAGRGDEDAVVALYESLSSDSRYTRFFQPTPRFTGRLRDALVRFDGTYSAPTQPS